MDMGTFAGLLLFACIAGALFYYVKRRDAGKSGHGGAGKTKVK